MPRIQHKRGTSANLASVNPTPLAGELVWDSTENAIKIGDGATAWSSLAYVTATPRTHVHDGADITTGTVAYARLPVGSTTSTVCAGDDARLADARTPTAHKASHATGGSDALSPSDIGAAPAASPTFSGTVTARNDAASNTFPLTVANGQNWAWGVGINFAQPATSGGAITDTARLVSDFDSTGDFSFRFHTMGGGTLAERMRITGAGRLAINAASDTVNHIIVARGSTTSDGAILLKSSSTGTAGNNGFLLQCFGATSDAYVWQYENSPLVFGTNSTERMRLTAGGDLAIGRTSAASRLDVNGVITVSATSGSAGSFLPSVCFASDPNTGFGQVSGQSDTASIFTAGHERVRVKSTGAVRFVPLSADPASGEAGDVYYNSTTNKLRVYNGTSWIDLH